MQKYCSNSWSYKQFASELSGGMRRRLSIAIALIRGTKTLIFDEPTTGINLFDLGLDPATRRQIWKIIEQIKKNPKRCIIITTHSMEEADALCNRISILCGGKIEAIGSQVHLKNKFSVGLKLTMIKPVTCLGELTEAGHIQKMVASETEALSILEKSVQEALCKEAVLEQNSIQHHMPKNNWNSTSIFLVPVSEKDKVVEIFSKIDEFCKKYSVVEWGFSQTSLEDVYVKVVLGSAEIVRTSNTGNNGLGSG